MGDKKQNTCRCGWPGSTKKKDSSGSGQKIKRPKK